MNEDVRLHDGSEPCVSPSGSATEESPGGGHSRVNGVPTAYAALDLGTNNCRLLIARVNNDGFRVIDSFSRIIRLGEGISTTGRISEAAISRAVGALTVCGDSFPICKTKLVLKVAAVTDGLATITGAGDVAAGATVPYDKGCTLAVFSADNSGYAEMRVTCQ